ncbi:hypothetical protein AT05_05805 [Schleiferia thermophila str. Yellowstone]|jgi:hypothetical protein|nr:hypothetical protein AT05_05805 [Schleiferia thermophila str. Yellowstone]
MDIHVNFHNSSARVSEGLSARAEADMSRSRRAMWPAGEEAERQQATTARRATPELQGE